MSGYFIRIRDGKFYIVAAYDDGTTEIHAEAKSREDAELQLDLATGSHQYEKQQLDLGL